MVFMSLIKNFKANIYYTFFILAIGAALSGLLFLYFRSDHTASAPATVLHGDSLDIPVTIADTAATREQGLSDTSSLPANTGMLFKFDTPSTYGFWMKDMNYPLDMIWFDSSFKVVDITVDATPASYPAIFYPKQPVLYVLEVNADFSTAHSMHIGDQFALEQK
jgi:uncharacterized membrane protein (UPF0127 family)